MRLTWFLPLAIPAAALACSSSTGGEGGSSTTTGSGGATSTASGSGGTTTTSSSTHQNQCVQTTDTGNANGVGAYCTPLGKECQAHPLAPLCLADIGQDEWFCTRLGCQTDTDCGDGATCVKQTGGSGCVPTKCVDGSDAGTDGG
jgi:hypothetical protein